MELQDLIDDELEDLDLYVTAASLDADGDLCLVVEYDSHLRPDGRQRIELKCIGQVEFDVTVGYVGAVAQYMDHPLLEDHRGAQAQLFFSSVPKSPEEVFYLFANAHASRMRLLVHDGFGVWCAARRLNQGGFDWPRQVAAGAPPLALTQDQFNALVLGLPWQRLEQMRSISHM